MPRRIILVVLTSLLALAVQAQESPGFSVELGLEPEKSPDEKIAELTAKIAEQQATGQLTAALGDMFNDLGVLYAQQGAWPDARMAFIQAVQSKPFDGDFHRNLALVAIEQEDYDLALAELGEYHRRGGANATDVHRRLAHVYMKLGDVNGARGAYQTGLEELGPEPSAELCKLALALAGLENDQGNNQAMRDVLETWQPVARRWRDMANVDGQIDGVSQAESIENNLLAVYVEDGQILEDSELWAEAATLYEKAYELAPDRHEILPKLVGSYLGAGESLQARVKARLAREEFPEESSAWLASAKVYEAEFRLDEALVAYRTAYDLAPDTPGLRLKLGNLYMKQGQASEGRKYLAEAIDQPGTPTEVVFNYAVSLMREKKYSAAMVPLRRVTQEMPEFANGWKALAQCYRLRKQYTQSVAAYQKAFDLAPSSDLAFNLGVTAGRAEQWDTAIAAYDASLELDPSNLESAYNRAVALMRSDQLEEADLAFAAYRERDANHYRAALNHGVTLYKLGRYDDAVDVYNVTLELKETAEAWDNLGLAYQGMGKKKKAQSCFREAKILRGES